MTTDRPGPIRFLSHALLALSGWLAVLALVTLWLEPAGKVVVIAPGEMRALVVITDADVDLAGSSPLGPIALGRGRGFVRSLYGAGALLVLPVLTGGCLGEAGSGARVAAR